MDIKKMAVRYLLIKKRLLKKPVFLAILFSIPLLTFCFSFFATTEDSGFLHVALAAKDDSSYTLSVMESIRDGSETVVFTLTDSTDEAVNLVKKGEYDAAWIFEENIEEKIKELAKGCDVTLVTAYEKEESTMNNIAKEKIFAAFYSEISYRIYEQYCLDAVGDASLEDITAAYENNGVEGELIKVEYADSAKTSPESEGYLMPVLRGLLAAIMLLCALAATAFFLCDERDGVYTFLSKSKRFFVLFATNLCALSICGIFVSISLLFSDDYSSFLKESAYLILYIFCLSGFSSLIGSLIGNIGAFCVATPVLCTLSLILSPIFIDLQSIRILQRKY